MSHSLDHVSQAAEGVLGVTHGHTARESATPPCAPGLAQPQLLLGRICVLQSTVFLLSCVTDGLEKWADMCIKNPVSKGLSS